MIPYVRRQTEERAPENRLNNRPVSVLNYYARLMQMEHINAVKRMCFYPRLMNPDIASVHALGFGRGHIT